MSNTITLHYRDGRWGRWRGRRRQPAGALVLARAAGARLRREAALRARAQRAAAGGPGAPPPLARAARAELSAPGTLHAPHYTIAMGHVNCTVRPIPCHDFLSLELQLNKLSLRHQSP